MPSVTSWSIADFKSLGSAKLTLPGLTILAGANSSGKSSILQSMLMIGQSAMHDQALVLNGQLVRLGAPRDVLRDGQDSIEICVGIEAEITAEDQHSIGQIEVSVSLEPDDDLMTLVPATYEIRGKSGEFGLEATSARSSTRDAQYLSRELEDSELTFLRVASIGEKRAPNRMYIGFHGITPVVVAVHRSKTKIKNTLGRLIRGIVNLQAITYEFYYEVANTVSKPAFFEDIGIDFESLGSTAQRRRSRSEHWSPRDFDLLNSETLEVLKQAVVDSRSQDEWIISDLAHPYASPSIRRHGLLGRDGIVEKAFAREFELQFQLLRETAVALDAFAENLKYLGPLRDEPKVVHGVWDERVSSLPVGSRGELTADVLTREKDTRIRYRTPKNGAAEAPLPEAVSDWCRYLGIGDGIEVQDHGKLGRGVTLTMGGKPRDLTMIGVGASQLLPILVAGLSAPRDSILLIEQPELHLHPSVQSKIADFFLFARPEVRFVVETHSEYLVTRVRRRVAEAKIRPLAVDVQFAERIAGVTKVRALGLSELGDFEDWPEGFFDEQENDSRFILRAIAAKLQGSKI